LVRISHSTSIPKTNRTRYPHWISSLSRLSVKTRVCAPTVKAVESNGSSRNESIGPSLYQFLPVTNLSWLSKWSATSLDKAPLHAAEFMSPPWKTRYRRRPASEHALWDTRCEEIGRRIQLVRARQGTSRDRDRRPKFSQFHK